MRRDEDGHGAFRIWRGHPVDGGVYRGSAFAVGTRHVATCRHVLDDKTASDDEIAGWAPQFWVDGFGLPAALRVDRLWCLPLKADSESDLALLEVRGSIPEPLQLTLEPSRAHLPTQTPILLLGYGDPKQPPLSSEAKTRSFNPSLETFILSGLVPTGMSGGPALREGQVIGVTVARAHEEGAVDIIPASFVRDLFKKAGLTATDLAGIGWAGDDMPSPPPDFIGRQATIEKLAVLIRSAQPGDCFVLHGIPGVGKTTIAAHLARLPDIVSHFNGRVYWVGVGSDRMNQGFLLAWAQALGLYNEAARTPDLSRRKLALRKAVAGQQVLLIADSVCTPKDADIHKLEGDCVHLFTTRFPQIALQAATAPSRAIEAKELQPEEGIKLLASYTPTAVVHHRKSVAKIVEAIGALPLALGLIGRDLQRNAYRPPKRIRHALERILSARIADSLDAVVYWSLHGLTRNELAALLCLSVFRPKPNTFDDQAALAVSDATDETLYRLLDAGLLEFVGSDHDDLQQDRYTLHQTIQEHTSRCLAEDASLETMAYSRLIGPYVTLLEAKATSSARRAAEVVNINAALNRAPQKEGYDRLLVRGANAYADFLLVRGLNDLSTGFLRSALNAYQKLDDPVMRAETSLNLAFHLEKLGEYTEADRYLNENEGQIVLGEPTRAARMYYVRAVIAYNLGEFSRAEESVCRGIEVLGLSPLDRFCGHLTRLSASNAAPKFTGILCRLLERRSITHLALDDIQRARQDWVDGIRIARHSSDQLGITVQRPLSLQERSA